MVRLTIRVDPPFILAYFVFHKGEFWTNFSQNAYGQARRGDLPPLMVSLTIRYTFF